MKSTGRMLFLALLFLVLFSACGESGHQARQSLDLAGTWQFALDPEDEGVAGQWYLSELGDRVGLPGTTDSNRKGRQKQDTTTLHLNRSFTYEGPAWYRREVRIPKSFAGKRIVLSLERTKNTTVWIDSLQVGASRILQSPQVFELTDFLTPGKHFISIRVDNSLALTPYGNVHIYSDHTQTNWNGIIGHIFLEASDPTYISKLKTLPDVHEQKVQILLGVESRDAPGEMEIELSLVRELEGRSTRLQTERHTVPYSPEVRLEYLLGDQCELWDECGQALYHLRVDIEGAGFRDSRSTTFGMRQFSTRGRQFTINGRPVFLRGKNDAAVFPLSGHTPMDEEAWIRYFSIVKEYGLNHCRYHSYCPPEAAFRAADRCGIYLQAELPFWGGLESEEVAAQLFREGKAMLDHYGDHPSFVMFSAGNEIWSGHDRVEEIMDSLKNYDNRPLYAMGSNNNIGYLPPRDYSDFFVGARIPAGGDSTLWHTRLTHAFADSRQGGILNTRLPSADVSFDTAIQWMDLPLISHEIGQYQVYPDYDEIEKYTGVLRAWNLEVFRAGLTEAGMGHMDSLFQQATGRWSALCYMAEMEAALRTGDMGGFQLLDLQDFPGQGTALVGILDAFMDSKGVVSAEEWKQSCNDVVLLLTFPKYCYTRDDNFVAGIDIANYSPSGLETAVEWELRTSGGTLLLENILPEQNMPVGKLHRAGTISFDLGGIQAPEKLLVSLRIPGTEYANTYPIWVYPPVSEVTPPPGIQVCRSLDPETLAALEAGARVLLFPGGEGVDRMSIDGHFPPEFWNYGMFKKISEDNGKPVSPGTLGILCDPSHALFNSFPTDFHTHWQWFRILRSGRSMILDQTPAHYLPLVQVVDNLERNHKLGLVYEFTHGKGELLVCMSPLPELQDIPEAVQLYRSILAYMESDAFDPAEEIPQALLSLFN